jgi:CheY-like chemotaxis protein
MKKILVVDDEKEVVDLLKDVLTQNHFSVVTASSGSEAFEIAKTNDPDLILLDIAMPETDGYMTCDKLQSDKNTQNIPVLFITGKELDPEGVLMHCQNLSVSGYISKMSSLDEIMKGIRKSLFSS